MIVYKYIFSTIFFFHFLSILFIIYKNIVLVLLIEIICFKTQKRDPDDKFQKTFQDFSCLFLIIYQTRSLSFSAQFL